MRRTNLVAGLFFLAFSLWVVLESRNLTFYTTLGPGPGFFPFWLGLFVGVMSVAWMGQVALRAQEPMAEGFFPQRDGVLRIVAIIVSVALFGLLVEIVGFRLIMFGFLLFLLLALGRQNLLLTLVICAIGSFGLVHLFSTYLGVFLPSSSIEFLANLGL